MSIDKKKTSFDYFDKVAALKTSRALCSILNHSTQMLDKLKAIQMQRNTCQEPLGIVNDVCKQWWSTYDMLAQVTRLKIPINHLFYGVC
jgi:hypothetical protein